MELMNAEASSKQLLDEFVQKRLLLIKLKSALWDEKCEELNDLVYNQSLPSNLSKGEIIIKYFVSYNDLYLTYYTANKKGVKKLESVDFLNQLKQFTHAVKTGVSAVEEQRFFYNLLIEPIQQELCGVNQLIILPDEGMDGITFELLMNAEEELLIHNYAIRYAYSAKNICQKSQPQIDRFLALAPGFEKNKTLNKENVITDTIRASSFIYNDNQQTILAPISCSIDEVEEIGNLFKERKIKTKIFTSKRATKKNFIKNLSMQNIVHIATHGINKNEYESGLFFTLRAQDNGFLSLQELYQLDLNVDLAVLSACGTGKGEIVEGEGVMALPRGFIYAGVPNVIASLWKVHDEKTKDLMVAFYKHLLEDKVSYAEALRLAKLDCIKKGFLPLDWAGFVLICN